MEVKRRISRALTSSQDKDEEDECCAVERLSIGEDRGQGLSKSAPSSASAAALAAAAAAASTRLLLCGGGGGCIEGAIDVAASAMGCCCSISTCVNVAGNVSIYLVSAITMKKKTISRIMSESDSSSRSTVSAGPMLPLQEHDVVAPRRQRLHEDLRRQQPAKTSAATAAAAAARQQQPLLRRALRQHFRRLVRKRRRRDYRPCHRRHSLVAVALQEGAAAWRGRVRQDHRL